MSTPAPEAPTWHPSTIDPGGAYRYPARPVGWRLDPRRPCASGDPDRFVSGGQGWAQTTARRLCEGCPVWRECLSWALASGNPRGTWGGTTWAQRARAIDRRAKRKAA